MVMELILYDFLASLGIFLGGILQFLSWPHFFFGKTADKAPKIQNF